MLAWAGWYGFIFLGALGPDSGLEMVLTVNWMMVSGKKTLVPEGLDWRGLGSRAIAVDDSMLTEQTAWDGLIVHARDLR